VTSAIVYPDWYQGGRYDVERVLRDLFTDPANMAQIPAGVKAVSWIPPDYAEVLATGTAFLRIFRMGGSINVDSRNWVDQPRVQFAALSAIRDDSWALLTFACEVLDAYRDGGHVMSNSKKIFIQVAGEIVGPQLIPEQMRDERLVTVTYEIHVDRDRRLPYYRTALNLNNT
jgi:hypothetical protein